MSKGTKSRARQRVGKKKPYRSPELTVHGNIRDLTRAKAGTKNDGTGKPATKSTGAPA